MAPDLTVRHRVMRIPQGPFCSYNATDSQPPIVLEFTYTGIVVPSTFVISPATQRCNVHVNRFGKSITLMDAFCAPMCEECFYFYHTMLLLM